MELKDDSKKRLEDDVDFSQNIWETTFFVATVVRTKGNVPASLVTMVETRYSLPLNQLCFFRASDVTDLREKSSVGTFCKYFLV